MFTLQKKIFCKSKHSPQKRAYCPHIYTVYSGPKNAHNDIAIIILENDFILDRHIDTICLPSRVDRSEISIEDCIATGM